jgi:hypothetical protein
MSLLFVGFMRGYIERERRKDVGLYLHPQLAPKYGEPPPYERERERSDKKRKREVEMVWLGYEPRNFLS